MADKELHIVYYGKDGDAAKARAAAIRAERQTAHLRHAEIFDGAAEECAAVTIMPDVSGHDAGRINAAYGDKVVAAKVPLLHMAPEFSETAAFAPLAIPVTLPPVPAPVPARNPNRR